MKEMNSKILHYLYDQRIVLGLLVLAVFLPYSNIFQNAFVYDDHAYFETWPGIRQMNIAGYFSGDNPVNFHHVYRPVRSLIMSLVYQLAGQNVLGYHIFAWLVHFINTWLIFLIAKKIWNQLVAVAAAIVFAVLAVHVESVTFIIASFNSAGIIFLLAAFYFYIRFRETNTYSWLYYSIALGAVAYFTYEMTLILPLLLIIYDVCFKNLKKSDATKAGKFYFPYFVLAAVLLFIRYQVLKDIRVEDLFQKIELLPRLLTMTKAIVKYIYLTVANYPLSVYHPFTVVSRPDLAVLGSIAVIAVFLWVAWLAYKKNYKSITFCMLWFFIALVPVANIVQIASFANENYLYLASAACAFFLGYIFNQVLEKKKFYANHVIAAFVILASVYGLMTWQRNFDWKNDETLWTKTIQQHPEFTRSYSQLGEYFLAQGDLAKAKKYIADGLRVNANHSAFYIIRGDILVKEKNYDQAIESYTEAIHIRPNYAPAYHGLGYAYLGLGDLDSAEKNFLKATELYSTLYDSLFNLAVIYFEKQDFAKAQEYFFRAYAIQPYDTETVLGLGLTYKELGDKKNARRYLEEALTLDPHFSAAREALKGL